MKKSDFLEIEKRYNKERARLQGIKIGDLVWNTVSRGCWNMDYHPAVIKAVNVDESYVDVIDVSDGNKEKSYSDEDFVTEAELLEREFTKGVINGERKKYKGIIKMVLAQND